jgi:hypothetical protein
LYESINVDLCKLVLTMPSSLPIWNLESIIELLNYRGHG